MTVALVAALGALGVLARYGLSSWAPGAWTIAAVNLAGSFALGLVLALDLPRPWREGVAIGLLGGLTTFSTFSAQVVGDLEDGRALRAGAVVLVSVAGGLLAAWAGLRVGRSAA